MVVQAEQSTYSFQLLGQVSAQRDGEPVELGPRQQQAVLSMLLLYGGRPVTMQELVDGVWDGQPPPRARGAIRNYVSRLRTAFEPGRPARTASRTLLSVPGGYALQVPSRSIDSLLFEQEAADRTGDPRTVYNRLLRALARWRGNALAGVPGPYAQRQRDRLAELQLTTREALYGYALELGLHAESVPELSLLADEFPLRERLQGLLMLALYRSGRQAEALIRYANTRRTLLAELGTEPEPELSALHQRILSADPGLSLLAKPVRERHTARPERPVPPTSHTVFPQQLPAGIPDFTGRSATVEAIRTVLTGRSSSGHSVIVSHLTGIGGVGKTALALHVAHSLRADFPDGQLHVDLGAGSTPADPAGVLTDFLIALGSPSAQIPLNVGQRAALFRTLLADRQVLLVLDNARDAEQIRPLLPGTAGCAVLLTSRARNLVVPGAHRVDLDVPPEGDAMSLLAAIIGPQRVAAEPDAARSLVAACGCLPLAVRIVGSRLAARPGHSLASLNERLRDERSLLDELHVGDLAIASGFRLGYEQLKAEPAWAFRLLSLLDAPDLPLPVAAALLGMDECTTERLCETLVDAGMLESYGTGRYRFHDLLRVYARRQAEQTDTEDERELSLLRVLDLLLASVVRAAQTAVSDELPVGWLYPVDQPGMSFAGIEEARTWFRAEHALLAATVEQLLQSGRGALRKALDLLTVVAVSGVFEDKAHYQEVSRIAGLAAERAHADEDAEYQARALHIRAWLSFLVGRYQEAEADLHSALDCAIRADSGLRRHMSGKLLALVLWTTGRDEEAQQAVRTAEEFAGDPEDPRSPASLAQFVAHLHAALGLAQPNLTVITSVMRLVDVTGETLTTTDGLQRLGAVLYRPTPQVRLSEQGG
ncbi:BTAD domain-containing putative transcriptional regulator [Streptomyces sp. NPDC006703]|uniref:AfsR/SARP family transcriptional regulator n=1 Tax=Streptomyces sp. NPDC006703 TaxID=3364759 RepID=UPI0036CFA212